MATKTALVVGARGVIGGNLIRHLEREGGWNVIGLSRRGGADSGPVRHLAVDLLDRDDALAKLSELSNVTHIFYAAYQDRPTWAELVGPNLAMLTNVVDAIEPVAPSLEHVSLMQGYKVYGAHLGPFATPAKEDDPPHMPPEFNVDQQQFLERRQTCRELDVVGAPPVGGRRRRPGKPDESGDGDRRLRVDQQGAAVSHSASPASPGRTRA